MLRRAIGDIVLLLASLAAGAVITLIEVDVYRPRTDAPGIISVGVLAGISVLQTVQRIIRRYRLTETAIIERTANEALFAAARAVARITGTSIDQIGASAWLVQRTMFGRRRLVRVSRWRRTKAPVPSNIRWKRGKGVIGRCWEIENVVALETARLWAPYSDCSKSEWKRLANAIKLRMSHKDFRKIRGKYQGAVAVPMVGPEDEFIGCVCIDVDHGAAWAPFEQQAIVKVAGAAGSTIGNLVGAIGRWVYVSEV